MSSCQYIHEKFEMGVYNPLTRKIIGGSWKAVARVGAHVSEEEVKRIKKILDGFDHSVIYPVEYESEVEKLFARYTAVRYKNLKAIPVPVDAGAVIYGQLLKDPAGRQVLSLRIATDDGRWDFEYDKSDFDRLWSGLDWTHKCLS